MDLNTIIQDNIVHHKGVNYDSKTQYEKWPIKFKEEIMALTTEQGYYVPKSSEVVDLATNMPYLWKDNAKNQKAGITLSEEERTELKSLRQEVKTLWVDKEIPKKR